MGNRPSTDRMFRGVQPVQNGPSYCGPGFRYHWQSLLFIPAAAIEPFVFKRNVAIGAADELTWCSPAWKRNENETGTDVCTTKLEQDH